MLCILTGLQPDSDSTLWMHLVRCQFMCSCGCVICVMSVSEFSQAAWVHYCTWRHLDLPDALIINDRRGFLEDKHIFIQSQESRDLKFWIWLNAWYFLVVSVKYHILKFASFLCILVLSVSCMDSFLFL